MSTRRHSNSGYTLTEFLVSSLVVAMTMTVLVSTFVFGIKLYKTGIVKTWEQQKMNLSMELIADNVRAAKRLVIYRDYGTSLVATNFGNYVLCAGTTWSSAVYRAGTTLYYVPDAGKDNRASSTDDRVIASYVYPQTLFRASNYTLFVQLALMEPANTNVLALSAFNFFSPRNVRGAL